jgi:eukaryotic-like serine/threonine-protein kinase
MSITGTDESDTPEAISLLQARLALIARTLFVMIGVAALVFTALPAGSPRVYVSRYAWWLPQAVAEALLAAAWLYCRSGQRERRVLLAIDVCLPLFVCTTLAWLMQGVPVPFRPELTIEIVATHILVARAALVPSSPRRTAVIGALASVPIAVGTFVLYSVTGGAPGELSPRICVVVILVWSTFAVISTGITSRVIYGLRKEVRAAQHLGQYTLDGKIGEGGMGAVYRARHAMLRRPTAIKLLLPELAGEAHYKRFEREVQLTSQLTHPNTIAIYDYGRTDDGVFYYAMEYLDGTDLDGLVRAGGPLPPERVIHVLLQVCGALAEAHDVGLIHRDIKPANVLLCRRGGLHDVAKLVDFGLVKRMAQAGDVTLTQENALTGTPLYLAPEAIASGSELDARSDLYAVGALAYFLLTGAPPFEGKSVVEVCSHHLLTPPLPPSARRGEALPDDLEALVLACLEKDRARRPESALALGAALARCADARGWTQARAADWWRVHGEDVRRERERDAGETARREAIAGATTVAVDRQDLVA